MLGDVNSMVDKLIEAREERAKIDEKNEKLWAETVNHVFDTEYGIVFGKMLLNFLGVFKASDVGNPQKMIEDNGKRRIYLENIRPYLDPRIRNKIEE